MDAIFTTHASDELGMLAIGILKDLGAKTFVLPTDATMIAGPRSVVLFTSAGKKKGGSP